MTPKTYLFTLLTAISCSTPSTRSVQENTTLLATALQYTWTKVLDSSEWTKSYNFQMFSIRDTLWTLHHDGAWYSVDGEQWTKSQLTNVISNQAFLDYVEFNNAIYGLGYLRGT